MVTENNGKNLWIYLGRFTLQPNVGRVAYRCGIDTVYNTGLVPSHYAYALAYGGPLQCCFGVIILLEMLLAY